MFKGLAECFVPENVSTPVDKLKNDVRQFVFPNCTEEFLSQFMNQDIVWRRVTDMAERMEFIDRLIILMKEIGATTIENVTFSEVGGKLLGKKTYSCFWHGYDFSGVHRDLESLIIYLLVAALDEMKNRDERVTNSIVRAFTIYLDGDLKQEWLSSYCALKEDENGDELCFKIEDYESWKTKSEEDRLILIARAVATIRHLYTHKAKRAFECNLPIEQFPRDGYLSSGELRLIRCESTNRRLIDLLWDTVRSVARHRFESMLQQC